MWSSCGWGIVLAAAARSRFLGEYLSGHESILYFFKAVFFVIFILFILDLNSSQRASCKRHGILELAR